VIDACDLIEHVAVKLSAVERPGTKPREGGNQIVSLASGTFGDLVTPIENVGPKLLVIECRDRVTERVARRRILTAPRSAP